MYKPLPHASTNSSLLSSSPQLISGTFLDSGKSHGSRDQQLLSHNSEQRQTWETDQQLQRKTWAVELQSMEVLSENSNCQPKISEEEYRLYDGINLNGNCSGVGFRLNEGLACDNNYSGDECRQNECLACVEDNCPELELEWNEGREWISAALLEAEPGVNEGGASEDEGGASVNEGEVSEETCACLEEKLRLNESNNLGKNYIGEEFRSNEALPQVQYNTEEELRLREAQLEQAARYGQQLLADNEMLKDTVQQLDERVSKLEDQNLQLQHDNTRLIEQHRKDVRQRDELEVQLELADAELTAARAAAAAAAADSRCCHSKCPSADALRHVQQQVLDLELEREHLLTSIRCIEAELENQRNATTLLTGASAELAAANGRVARLEVELAEARERVVRMDRRNVEEAEELEQRIVMLEELLDKHVEEVEGLRSLLKESSSERELYVSKVEDLNASQCESLALIEELKCEMSALRHAQFSLSHAHLSLDQYQLSIPDGLTDFGGPTLASELLCNVSSPMFCDGSSLSRQQQLRASQWVLSTMSFMRSINSRDPSSCNSSRRSSLALPHSSTPQQLSLPAAPTGSIGLQRALAGGPTAIGLHTAGRPSSATSSESRTMDEGLGEGESDASSVKQTSTTDCTTDSLYGSCYSTRGSVGRPGWPGTTDLGLSLVCLSVRMSSSLSHSISSSTSLSTIVPRSSLSQPVNHSSLHPFPTSATHILAAPGGDSFVNSAAMFHLSPSFACSNDSATLSELTDSGYVDLPSVANPYHADLLSCTFPGHVNLYSYTNLGHADQHSCTFQDHADLLSSSNLSHDDLLYATDSFHIGPLDTADSDHTDLQPTIVSYQHLSAAALNHIDDACGVECESKVSNRDVIEEPTTADSAAKRFLYDIDSEHSGVSKNDNEEFNCTTTKTLTERHNCTTAFSSVGVEYSSSSSAVANNTAFCTAVSQDSAFSETLTENSPFVTSRAENSAFSEALNPESRLDDISKLSAGVNSVGISHSAAANDRNDIVAVAHPEVESASDVDVVDRSSAAFDGVIGLIINHPKNLSEELYIEHLETKCNNVTSTSLSEGSTLYSTSPAILSSISSVAVEMGKKSDALATAGSEYVRSKVPSQDGVILRQGDNLTSESLLVKSSVAIEKEEKFDEDPVLAINSSSTVMSRDIGVTMKYSDSAIMCDNVTLRDHVMTQAVSGDRGTRLSRDGSVLSAGTSTHTSTHTESDTERRTGSITAGRTGRMPHVKLEIVKPLEGSVTLNRWKSLYSADLTSILTHPVSCSTDPTAAAASIQLRVDPLLKTHSPATDAANHREAASAAELAVANQTKTANTDESALASHCKAAGLSIANQSETNNATAISDAANRSVNEIYDNEEKAAKANPVGTSNITKSAIANLREAARAAENCRQS